MNYEDVEKINLTISPITFVVIVRCLENEIEAIKKDRMYQDNKAIVDIVESDYNIMKNMV